MPRVEEHGVAKSAGYFDAKVTVEIETTALQDAAWMARVERSNRKGGAPRVSSVSDRSLEEIIAVCERAFPVQRKERDT